MNTWDETKRVKNLVDHGIDFADLDGFFFGDLLTREDARLKRRTIFFRKKRDI